MADPAKRMSIQEMQRHPWYQQDLPPGLTGFNDICLAQQRASGMVGSQSEDQIKAIVQVRGQPAPSSGVDPPSCP